jgi:hypothetical protein
VIEFRELYAVGLLLEARYVLFGYVEHIADIRDVFGDQKAPEMRHPVLHKLFHVFAVTVQWLFQWVAVIR